MKEEHRITLSDVDQTLKDFYPRAGERIKQYVVDTWRLDRWKRGTAPVFNVDPHVDNTGAECRNSGEVRYYELEHDCCSHCDELHNLATGEVAVAQWIMLLLLQPPIEPDHTKLSDEIQEDIAYKPNPWFAMLVRK